MMNVMAPSKPAVSLISFNVMLWQCENYNVIKFTSSNFTWKNTISGWFHKHFTHVTYGLCKIS
jgi:hypothetical protein